MADYSQRGNVAYQLPIEPHTPQHPAQPPRRDLDAELKQAVLRLLRVVGVAVAILCVCAACISLVYMKAEISAEQKQINTMNSEMETLQRENNALLANINSARNIYAITRRAQEMGMAYPQARYVLRYTPTVLPQGDVYE